MEYYQHSVGEWVKELEEKTKDLLEAIEQNTEVTDFGIVEGEQPVVRRQYIADEVEDLFMHLRKVMVVSK